MIRIEKLRNVSTEKDMPVVLIIREQSGMKKVMSSIYVGAGEMGNG